MPRKGRASQPVKKEHRVEKPQVPLGEITKYISDKLGVKKETVQDILNTYYDYAFDCLVDNREVLLPGIGRFWISDPRPHQYWDENNGKWQYTLTYPMVKFRQVERLKDSLKGEVFREMKRKYKEEVQAKADQEMLSKEEKEFNLHFRTKDPSK